MLSGDDELVCALEAPRSCRAGLGRGQRGRGRRRLRRVRLPPPTPRGPDGRYGHREAASTIASTILQAAPYFEHRLPEVFAGYPASVTSVPVAFPTASRPQAWAAGTPLLLLSTLLDLHPGSPDADVEVPRGIGCLALRSQRD